MGIISGNANDPNKCNAMYLISGLLSRASNTLPVLRLFIGNSLNESPVVSKNDRRLPILLAHRFRFQLFEKSNSSVVTTTLHED
ncbi:hypothetical protein VP1G_11211 [Cytospora mali]|uniref:Uncharacterized protein n=1 Tax=Cytospora mali TaxID=578113 RepID=A0A194V8T8_CYTMA|nr:hypothetical protein VP1G_11211 [Valsa mali var. pyri (nom. inval.)]